MSASNFQKIYMESGLTAPLHYLESCASTNDFLKGLARGNSVHGTVVVSKEQTGGKGRLGRTWVSRSGQGIYLSVLWSNPLPANAQAMLSLAAGVALAEVVQNGVGLKWPNDLYSSNGMKLGGILCEMESGGGGPIYTIIGIGLNTSSVPREVETAGCLDDFMAERIDDDTLCVRIVESVLRWCNILARDPLSVVESWRCHDVTSGMEVQIGAVKGTALGVADSGALQVLDHEGKQHEIYGGEIHWLRE